MLRIRICEDLEEGQRLWGQTRSAGSLFDLWPVRACFAKAYNRETCFLVAENNIQLLGLLPLSWIEEEQYFGYFPGETWQGQTWLEQNRIIAGSSLVADELLAGVPGPVRIRYLAGGDLPLLKDAAELDEIGYLFYPGQYNYSFDAYMGQFSGKSRKKLGRELEKLESPGVAFRYDHFPDIDRLFMMNQRNFGDYSYFSDSRFLKSFENLVDWLRKNRLLRVTTVLIGDEIAAVDVGAVWGLTYTVLAGGTSMDFPGVAKLINFHHIEWACRERLEAVDFLCGDFSWKERFHLTPRPLYKVQCDSRLEIWKRAPSSRSAVSAH